jgi:hypothetical protein
MPAELTPAQLRQRLAHVRWIGGGTGSGKSTVAAVLAGRFGLDIYHGDQGERAYVRRVHPGRQPRLAALLAMSPRQRWLDRSPGQVFAEMPSLHGETFPFVLDDILARPSGNGLLVDDFRTLPRDVAPLLSWRGQAVFLLPTASFREQALRGRYADPARARATWGDADPQEMLAARLARDELWDAEVRRQAQGSGLPVLQVDGTRSPGELAAELAQRFRLPPQPKEPARLRI